MKTLVKSNGSLLGGFPSVFDDFAGSDFLNSNWSPVRLFSGGAHAPAVNIKETADTYEVEVAAPGLSKENFKVELEDNMLTISGQTETNKEEKDGDGNYTRREFSCQSFQRSFTLPEDLVEKDKITARYDNGVLYVNIPRSENGRAKSARTIKIS